MVDLKLKLTDYWWRHEFPDKSSLLWARESQTFLYFDPISNWISVSIEEGVDDKTTINSLVQENLLPMLNATRRVDEVRKLLSDTPSTKVDLDSETAAADTEDSIPFKGYSPASRIDRSSKRELFQLLLGGTEIVVAFFDDVASNTLITAPFKHLLTPATSSLADNISISVGRIDGNRLWVDSRVTGGYIAETSEESMTLLYWMIFRAVQASRDWMLCLHAGAVMVDNQLVIITGPSGAGKTTLTIALSKKYRSYLTDELVCIERNTHRVFPMPTLPCVKEDAWSEIENHYLDILTTPSIFRLGKYVKFLPLPPDVFLQDQMPPVEQVIALVPRFDQNIKSSIAPLNPATLFQSILSSGGLFGDIQTRKCFTDLGNWLSKANGYRISYDTTTDALMLCSMAIDRSSTNR